MRISRSSSTDIVESHRRVTGRSPLRLAAVLHSDAGNDPVIVTDLNTDGCRLESACAASIDSPVTLIMSRSVLIGGRIAWRADDAIGVAFCAQLLPRAIAQALQSGTTVGNRG